ncbi:carboxymuconolactone decarboxylase family protein [Spirillospora sp. NPDC048911]|uniref:carboxymuconolactone decarboxylase family protein n=1 Tax=Spirillospora sp. NPDC048911 TaxID=3364527 RepID=UPI003719D620
MSPRMPNPALVVPGVLKPQRELVQAINNAGVPLRTLVLVHLRVSQLNGRSVQIPVKKREFEEAGEQDHRLPLVATWREQTCFTDAERAALALGEAITLISERDDPVTDEIWNEAAVLYNEQDLGALVIHIGLVNLWNRVNVATRQEPVDWRVNPKKWIPVTSQVSSSA